MQIVSFLEKKVVKGTCCLQVTICLDDISSSKQLSLPIVFLSVTIFQERLHLFKTIALKTRSSLECRNIQYVEK